MAFLAESSGGPQERSLHPLGAARRRHLPYPQYGLARQTLGPAPWKPQDDVRKDGARYEVRPFLLRGSYFAKREYTQIYQAFTVSSD